MYCKLFASLYQGTLRGKPHEILVFTNLLATCDKEGFVDKHFRAISEEVGLSIEEVKIAIQSLEAPDPESRSQDLNGSRLERLEGHRDWGWRIVNYIKYSSIKDMDERREYQRTRQAEYRTKKRDGDIVNCHNMSVTDCDKPHLSQMFTHIDVNETVNKNKTIINTPQPLADPSESAMEMVLNPKKRNKSSIMTHSKLRYSFIKAWSGGFERVFGEKYLYQEGKDDACIDKLTSHLSDIDAHMNILKIAWANGSDFDYKFATSISGYLSRFNQIKIKALGKTQSIQITHKPKSSADILKDL